MAAAMAAMALAGAAAGPLCRRDGALRRDGGAVAAGRRCDGRRSGAQQHGERRQGGGQFRARPGAARTGRRGVPRARTTSAASRRRSTGSATSPPLAAITTRRAVIIIRAWRSSARSTISGALRGVLSDLAQLRHRCSRPRGGDGPAQGGAAGVPVARPPARRRASARIACLVCRPPGARRRGGDAGERSGGDPHEDWHRRHKPAERERIDQTLALARPRLSQDDYAKAWDAGRTASLDRILGMGREPPWRRTQAYRLRIDQPPDR